MPIQATRSTSRDFDFRSPQLKRKDPSASMFLTGYTIENRPDALHSIEARNLVVFSAVTVRERQSVHFVVDVGNGDISLIANDVLAEAAGVNMSIISCEAASTAS